MNFCTFKKKIYIYIDLIIYIYRERDLIINIFVLICMEFQFFEKARNKCNIHGLYNELQSLTLKRARAKSSQLNIMNLIGLMNYSITMNFNSPFFFLLEIIFFFVKKTRSGRLIQVFRIF